MNSNLITCSEFVQVKYGLVELERKNSMLAEPLKRAKKVYLRPRHKSQVEAVTLPFGIPRHTGTGALGHVAVPNSTPSFNLSNASELKRIQAKTAMQAN